MKQKSNILFLITRKYIGFYLYFFFLVLFTSILAYATPYITQRVIDFAIPSKDWQQMINLMAVLLLFAFVRSFLVFCRTKFGSFFNWKILFSIKSMAVENLIRTPMSNLKKNDVGYWVGRINNDTHQLSSMLADQAIHILKAVIVIVIGCILLIQMNWLMSVITLSYLAFVLIILYFFGDAVRNRYAKILEYFGKLNGYMQNAIIWAPFAKLYMNHQKVLSYWHDGIARFFKAFQPVINIGAYQGFFMAFYTTSRSVLILGLGAWYIMHDQLTIGQLVAYISYYSLVSEPAMEMISQINNIQKSIPALERMNELCNDEPEYIGENPGDINELRFEDFACSYDSVKSVVTVKDATFHKNEVIGLVGHSGCGKSCLLMNLIGLYEPIDGSVTINENRTLKKNQTAALRYIAAYVEQEPVLLHDSVYENIRFGKPNATDEEVRKAAELAGADGFILNLPEQYNTMFGPSGTGISVGEKQRIAIARALVKDPKLLILDEPTSNVDKQTEEIILESVKAFSRDRIVIITSHNHAFLDICDKVYRVTDGMLELIESSSCSN